MKRRVLPCLVTVALLAPCLAHAQEQQKPFYKPPSGFVPDSVTAVRIAVAVWTSIYGAKTIQWERPYVAKLAGEVWFVRGSLPKPHCKGCSVSGGVAEAEIAKSDGRILRVSHGR